MNRVLIEPKEAARLANQILINEINRIVDIYKSVLEDAMHKNPQWLEWNQMCALDAVFMAGYMSGVRTERAKRCGLLKGARTE